MAKLYGLMDPEPGELELRNRALARRAAAEGFVLLKNQGSALPLVNERIALYGMGARKTVKGGLGSGSVEERYSVNIEDGLKNAGYEITTARWLDDYDREYDETYRAWHDMVEAKVAGITDPMKLIPLAHSYVYRYPSGRLIDEADIRESDTDTALYVLMRQAGECNDRKLEKGDYYITDIERKNLETLAAAYVHTILIINVGGHIELDFLDEIEGIDAVVLFVQGGEEGGSALADVLSGKENFSGKLSDTIPLRYEDIPYGDSFSYLNGNLEEEDYREDVYVGYRYYDSFDKPVRYPFGFGLSYTSFSIRAQAIRVEGREIAADVVVTNTGACAGKEVVQIYISAPQGELTREKQRLMAFAKTKTLAPGESETLTLRFDMGEAASYDERRAAWVLEQEAYRLRLGSSSRDTAVAAVLELPGEVITRQCRSCCAPDHEIDRLTAPRAENEPLPDSVPVIELDPAAFVTEIVDYAAPVFEETEEEQAILDSLSDEERLQLLCGGELQVKTPGVFDIPGAAGKTATALIAKGIPNVIFSDGPAGINVVNRCFLLPDGRFMPAEVPERYRWGVLGKMARQQLGAMKEPIVHRYATAWPVEMLLAQTWNTRLLREIGMAVGEEMKLFGVSVWLAPGMNIHRNPLGGRAFEYYSEDPVLTGEMAAALTLGVQSHKGVGVSVKHFCCNNSEDNRNGISENVSERALREIYLKGFEIAVKKAQPLTVMSSYNRLNGIYTANRRDLLTDILRCEWGFRGLVMTDWGSTNEKAAVPERCAGAGNDLIMPGNSYDHGQLAKALAEGRLDMAAVRISTARVLRLVRNTLPEKE